MKRFAPSEYIVYKAPRGTVDVLPQDQKYWRYVEAQAVKVCQRFGYHRIDTPVFEDAGLFLRGVGEATDIVQKETYTFDDRGGNSLTLRPEGTAPVCRAYLERGMSNLPQPVRLHYICPIFRYERPQAGRYRQHHQFGIEAIGDGDPLIDAEVIQLGWSLTQELGLRDLELVINSIGDQACRPDYLKELKAYYEPHLANVCQDCNARHQRNPLRLLDCKQESCQAYIEQAPASVDHLCAACGEHWNTLLSYLDKINLPYRKDHRLVRGLDYYTRTVFEIQPPEEGSQNTIIGGGRYDGLIEQLGGRATPGIGFGSGIERFVLNLKRQEIEVPEESSSPIVIVHLGDAARIHGLELASRLRDAGLQVLMAPAGRSLRSQLRYSSSLDAQFSVVIGDDELARSTLAVRNMTDGTQQDVPDDEVVPYLRERFEQ